MNFDNYECDGQLNLSDFNSNSQLYKQAGNSIVKKVLEQIFLQFITV